MMSSVVGAGASAVGGGSVADPSENPENAINAKKLARLQELQHTYHLVRAL